MSDDRLEEIREEKLERLQARAAGEATPAADDQPAADGPAGTPDDPFHVRSTDDLDDAVATHDVVLVDFYADWCGPCQMLEPVLERLAAETDAAVAKVDTDANPAVAQQYGVRGLPTLVLFADGERVERLVGMQQEDQLRRLVERHA